MRGEERKEERRGERGERRKERGERRAERADKSRGEEKIAKVKNITVNNAIPRTMTESSLRRNYCDKP